MLVRGEVLRLCVSFIDIGLMAFSNLLTRSESFLVLTICLIALSTPFRKLQVIGTYVIPVIIISLRAMCVWALLDVVCGLFLLLFLPPSVLEGNIDNPDLLLTN